MLFSKKYHACTSLCQKPGFDVSVAKTFFSNSFISKLAMTGDNGSEPISFKRRYVLLRKK